MEEWQAKRGPAPAGAQRLTTAFLDGTHPVVDVYELKVGQAVVTGSFKFTNQSVDQRMGADAVSQCPAACLPGARLCRPPPLSTVRRCRRAPLSTPPLAPSLVQVRLEHMLQRLRVLQQATLTGRPCRLMPRLYLSGAVEASSLHMLRHLGITHVLNATEVRLARRGERVAGLGCSGRQDGGGARVLHAQAPPRLPYPRSERHPRLNAHTCLLRRRCHVSPFRCRTCCCPRRGWGSPRCAARCATWKKRTSRRTCRVSRRPRVPLKPSQRRSSLRIRCQRTVALGGPVLGAALNADERSSSNPHTWEHTID